MASKLLIDDYPIQVLPSLAQEIGLNEAIVLQQMHYWLNSSKHKYDDKKWIYNSYSKWVKQFPFWSESTVKRAINSLEKQGFLFVSNYNKASFDKTKWYSINYSELEKRVTRPSGQNDPTMRSIWSDDEVNMTRPIPETTTETTTETTKRPQQKIKNTNDLLNEYDMDEIKNPTKSMELHSYHKIVGDEMFVEAIKEAKKYNNRTGAYVSGILKKWTNQGKLSYEEIKRSKAKNAITQLKSNNLDDITEEDIFGG